MEGMLKENLSYQEVVSGFGEPKGKRKKGEKLQINADLVRAAGLRWISQVFGRVTSKLLDDST